MYQDTLPGSVAAYQHLTPMDMGNLTVSYFTLNTLFIDKTGDDYSRLFKDFENNRLTISKRIGYGIHDGGGAATADSVRGYTLGYGRYSQAVLIPAFLAAYTDKDAASSELDIFKTMPLPNWKLTYSALPKIPMFGKIFTSFSLTHGYKSTLTVNTYRTNLLQTPDANGSLTTIDQVSKNYYALYDIPDIVISEQLQPLIGVDFRLKNDITGRFDYKKTRMLTMNFSDYQVNETRTDEFTIGAGYRVKGLKLPFTIGKKKPAPIIKKEDKDTKGKGKAKAGGGGTTLENDLNVKFDMSYRQDITFNRPIDQDPVRTRGLTTIRIAPSIDYQVNKNLNVRLFYDYSQTIPATSASFPITNTQGGVTIRFSLGR